MAFGGGEERRAYEEKRPWDFVVAVGEVVDEVEHDSGDDEGGDELSESDEVEGDDGVVGWLLLDFAFRHIVKVVYGIPIQ